MQNANYNPRDWDTQPPTFTEDYKSTSLRSPKQPLIPLAQGLGDVTGPVFGHEDVDSDDADMTRNGVVNGEPLGERIIVTGRVIDEGNKPVANTLVELWQANAAGRYIHKGDQHGAPLDPNFFGDSLHDVSRQKPSATMRCSLLESLIKLCMARVFFFLYPIPTTPVTGFQRIPSAPQIIAVWSTPNAFEWSKMLFSEPSIVLTAAKPPQTGVAPQHRSKH